MLAVVVVAIDAVEAAAMVSADCGPNNEKTKSRRVSQVVYDDEDEDDDNDDGDNAVGEDTSWEEIYRER